MAFLDKTGLERLWAHVISQLGHKVEKVDGKGLSTNDFTNEEKEKLANLSTVSVTGDYNDLFNKPEIPSVEGLVTEGYVNDIVTARVDNAVTNLINSAPETLDTLGELATAMQENEDVIDALNSAIGNKVDKVDGMGLSANDYTNEEKEKLAGIAEGAEVNVQSDWNVTDDSADDYIKNKPEIATDDDIIAMMQEIDMFPVVMDENGSIMTDEDGSILLI